LCVDEENGEVMLSRFHAKLKCIIKVFQAF